jgi:hypothetical protein
MGGLHQPSALDAGGGRAVRIQSIYLGQLSGSATVIPQPGLELRTAADTTGLRKRLQELHRTYPADFPLTPAKASPEIPAVLPEGWDLADFLGGLNSVDEPAALKAKDAWSQELAFYRSPRHANSVSFPWEDTAYASDWGIYLHSAGVEKVARALYRSSGFDNTESLSLATQDLLNHERQHAAFDITALRLEAATGPSLELGRHGCSPCLNEEALCEAAVARAAEARADEAIKSQGVNRCRHSWALLRLKAWLTAGPPGYRDWAKATSEKDRDRLITEVLGHDGVPTIIGLALYKDTDTTVHIPDIPVYLVLTPGSAAAAGQWEYDTL